MVSETRRPPSTRTDADSRSTLTHEQRSSAAAEAARQVARTLRSGGHRKRKRE